MRWTTSRAVLVAALVAIAVSRALAAVPLPESFLESRAGTYLWPFVVDGLFQCGILAAAIAFLLELSGRISPAFRAGFERRLRSFAIGAAIAVPVAFLTGEIFLRIVYPQGESFSEHIGPFVRRYERDVRWNAFEGPSRGPDDRGPKAPATLRLLIQGDSITWGQGIRDDAEIYTTRLRDALRARRPGVEMAVLAQCGREIDGHRANLERYAPEIRPDLVIYAWHPTDMERSVRHLRPKADPPWTKLFFHPLLKQTSWLWFFVDFQAKTLINPDLSRQYREYLLAQFGGDTPAWRTFADEFRAWAADAKAETPRVLVMLYPDVGAGGFVLAPIHERMKALCAETGVAVLDLAEGEGLLGGDVQKVSVSKYDGHPNAVVHGLIAARLVAAIEREWPDVVAVTSPSGSSPGFPPPAGSQTPGSPPVESPPESPAPRG